MSIVAAVFITTIAAGVQSTEASPKATVDTDLVTGFTSAANIVLSYGQSFPLPWEALTVSKAISRETMLISISTASHNAFITFMGELRDVQDFPKSLALLQTIDISLYAAAAVVIYYYASSEV